jgi:hypothetical protein
MDVTLIDATEKQAKTGMVIPAALVFRRNLFVRMFKPRILYDSVYPKRKEPGVVRAGLFFCEYPWVIACYFPACATGINYSGFCA